LGKNKTKKWFLSLPNVAAHFFSEELKRETLFGTLKKSLKKKNLKFSQAETLCGLLEKQAKVYPQKPFIYFEDQTISFGEADDLTNSVGNYLSAIGFSQGDGLGIMMGNCPEFIYTYYATQRMGMYMVPINTALRGDGLEYIINHSDIKILIIDAEQLPHIEAIKGGLKNIESIYVRGTSSGGQALPSEFQNIDIFFSSSKAPSPSWKVKPDDISTIMYTSGTTGRPKGVVFDYSNTWLRRMGLFAHLIFNKDDVIYTCLPLFHANALFLTFSASLWLGIPVVLAKKFSASKFWDEVNEHGATTFSSIGAMIPILLKSPKKADDSANSIRLVLSAACPAHSWEEFEDRFGLKIWEGYSAVDGGSRFIFNLGNAPVGSIGRPMGVKYKLLKEDGSEAGARENGELVFCVDGEKKAVHYFKNEKATSEKVRDGLLYSGDILYKDEKGYLYFVGRKTESMRRRGENVSAFEIENTILKHPDILECAAFGVPSQLAEEDIMCVVVPVGGQKIEPENLKQWLGEKLASFAIPRYIRVMNELPKTATHRVIKGKLKDQGVTLDTIDLES
jgi:carnitine-CoA ligase